MNFSESAWVLAANLAVWAVVPGTRQAQVVALLENAGEIVVPALWVYEVTSALRKTFYAQPVPEETIWQIMDGILQLPDEIIPADSALARRAYQWADKLGQLNVYDAFYLALAERLEAELWTGDNRLYNRAHQIGADFVRLVGET